MTAKPTDVFSMEERRSSVQRQKKEVSATMYASSKKNHSLTHKEKPHFKVRSTRATLLRQRDAEGNMMKTNTTFMSAGPNSSVGYGTNTGNSNGNYGNYDNNGSNRSSKNRSNNNNGFSQRDRNNDNNGNNNYSDSLDSFDVAVVV